MTHPTDDPLREALVTQALHDADTVSQMITDGKRIPRSMTEDLRNHIRKLSATLAPAPQPAPAPADERAAMIEVITAALYRHGDRGWTPSRSVNDIADALLAAGWTRGGAEAGLIAAATELRRDMMERSRSGMDVIHGQEYRIVNAGASAWSEFCKALDAALARPSAPETLAWAVVGAKGAPIAELVTPNKSTAQAVVRDGERVVRVAIRVVEDGGD